MATANWQKALFEFPLKNMEDSVLKIVKEKILKFQAHGEELSIKAAKTTLQLHRNSCMFWSEGLLEKKCEDERQNYLVYAWIEGQTYIKNLLRIAFEQ